ncbi:MAG TPA: D-2-hydroxyacid dehydrogenase family protein [Stellaceae bacterium]|nr:D-2-hydroxyacid dehydrogenase family protein [Stellaceae bacterium]
MMHVALLDDYQGIALRLADWKSLQPEVQVEAFPEHIADGDALAKRLHIFECVVLMRERTPLGRALIEKLPNLKLVITSGMHNASVDAAALAERGIVYCGTDGLGHSTAELTWGLILCLLRNIPHEDRALRQGRWQTRIGFGAKGKTLGIIGLGRLGKLVAGYGKAFGMDVIGWSRSFDAEKAAELGIRSVDKETLLAQADIVTIHVGLSDSSRGLLGAADLARMKPTSYLVNTSRAPIVDQAALLAALKGRRIAGAAIDVFDNEPVTKGHPFFELDNVVVTPHLGYAIEENFRINYGSAVENIRAFLDGKPIRLVKSRG